MATRYIKLFETEANRQTYEHSANYQEPYSSGVVDTESAYYNKLDSSVSEIYRACAYIENPSTAYINTGIKGSGSQRIECEFMPMKQTTAEYNCVYGARTSAGKTHDGIYIYSNTSANNVGYVGYNNTSTNNLASAYASLGVVHKVIQNGGTFTLDGNLITSYTNASFTCTNATIYIFNGNNNGTLATYYGYIRLYSFKIYNNNQLVRDFIPVQRIEDSKYGLYDKITKAFFTSPNNVQFIGPNVPDEYISVNYIENHALAGAYINTGISAASNLGVEIKARAAYDGTNNGKESIFFGASTNAAYKNGNNYCIEKGTTNNLSCVAYKTSSSGTNAIGAYNNYNNPFIIQFNFNSTKNGIVFDHTGKQQLTKALTLNSNIPTSLNLYLFCRNVNNAQDTGLSYPIRVYYCRMWQGVNIVRNFVPVKRKSDSVYGLYDTINGVFYTSQNSIAFFGA